MTRFAQALPVTGLNQTACVAPLVWSNPPGMGNFDSVPNAILVMFELATEENWPSTMCVLCALFVLFPCLCTRCMYLSRMRALSRHLSYISLFSKVVVLIPTFSLYSTSTVLAVSVMLHTRADRYAFVDSAGPGRAPAIDSNQWVAIWFVVCIFINSFFIKDLFVGVVVDTYNLNFSRLTGAAKLTAAQTEWLDLYKVL